LIAIELNKSLSLNMDGSTNTLETKLGALKLPIVIRDYSKPPKLYYLEV
jgi:hypothetical protein